jgi:hypothetical protein
MPDITMCVGTGCPLKEKCYRYIAKPSEYQYYFMEAPYKDGKCDYYWGDNNNSIWEQLLDIKKV